MMTHWAAKYVGKQWDALGDGESTFNCWTFVQHVQRSHYGRELPDVAINAAENLAVARACIETSQDTAAWQQVATPRDGDCVLMARSRNPVHVGVWVQAGAKAGVLHCARGLGVTHQTPLDLRTASWGRLTYYRWIGND